MIKSKPIIFLPFILCMLVFSSCGNESPKVQPDSIPVVATQISIDTFRNSGVCLNIPRNMVPVLDLNPDAFLQFANSENEEYLIIIREDKKAFADSVKTMPFYRATGSLVENYCRYWRTTMEEKLDSISGMREIHRPSASLWTGLDARSFMQQLDFVANVEGVPEPIAYKMGFVEGKEYMYVLTAWTLASHQKENDPQYERILASFIEE